MIWAGFGLVGNTETKLGADSEQLLSAVFSFFRVKKKVEIFEKYCSVRTKKLLKMKVKKK